MHPFSLNKIVNLSKLPMATRVYVLQGVGGSGNSEGCIQQTVAAVFQHLALVPSDRYQLRATYSGMVHCIYSRENWVGEEYCMC